MAVGFDQLYHAVTSFENLFRAHRKASRGKRHQPQVADFEVDLEGNLLRLQEESRGPCCAGRTLR
jgi:hypothetical protein